MNEYNEYVKNMAAVGKRALGYQEWIDAGMPMSDVQAGTAAGGADEFNYDEEGNQYRAQYDDIAEKWSYVRTGKYVAEFDTRLNQPATEPSQTFQPPDITTTQTIPGVESWGVPEAKNWYVDPITGETWGAPTEPYEYQATLYPGAARPGARLPGAGTTIIPSRTATTTAPMGEFYTDPQTGQMSRFNTRTGGYDPIGVQNPNWTPSAPTAQPMSEYERAMLGIRERESTSEAEWRRQQIEADKRADLAQLRARPASWLEYAQRAGETPGVQPWQVPLMPQQYAGTVAGAPLPGYSATAPRMSDLPALTNPSVQYWARMGPTAQQQYMGYEQARTGAPPEETAFRLRAGAPPSGWNQPLQWNR